MDKTAHETLRKGFFPLRISVNDKQGMLAVEMLTRFIQEMSQKYDLQVITSSHPDNSPRQAEAIIAVPFPDKEPIRVDFNVFASVVEYECGDAYRFYFFMESAY